MKILIVDDDDDSRVFLERALRGQHYSAESAANGAEALEKARQRHPDLIISDILMPVMNGFELCRRIKTDAQLRRVPFIFYTATFVDQRDEELAMSLGASRFIVKPIDPADFLKIVEEVINEREKDALSVPDRPLGEMEDLCRKQAEALARKLDKKVIELEKGRRALVESEERFHQLFEQNANALMLLKQGATEIIDINPSVVGLYGYPKEEFIVNGLSILFSPDDLQRFEETLLTLEKHKTFTIENILTHASNAKAINVSIRGQIVRLQNRDVIYCDITDITEQIRLKKETAIMQSKLIFANKMSSLGVLVSSVAHEINNPNNFILFNSSLVSDVWKDAIRILDEYQQEKGEFSLAGLTYKEMREAVEKLLEGITRGSQRIKEIVNNLKDFARQDTAGLGGIVAINKVIAASVAMLDNEIKKHTKNFRAEYGKELPEIRGSSQQLEQVVINLLMNALEALTSTDSGVMVSTSYDSSTHEIIVEIKDEGTGIPENMLDRIMEPFFTTKHETGGTGLGLPISHSIIRDHKGTLQFQLEQGKGTRTFIRLPSAGENNGVDQ
jgi:PAS domain S-box-containing protein